MFPVYVKIIKQLSSFLASLLHEALWKAIGVRWRVQPSACRYLTELSRGCVILCVLIRQGGAATGSFSVVLLNCCNSLQNVKLQNSSDVDQVLVRQVRVSLGTGGGIFCAVLLTAWKVALQLGVAQILLNLSKMAVGGVTHWRAMLVNCIVTEQPCMARKGKLLPISTRNPCKISTVRSRCCLRSFSDLTQELLCVLGTWLTFQLVGGLTDFTNWVPFIADFFFPKSKEQGATREFSSWMGGRVAWVSGKCRCWRKQHCAFNIFPGISCSFAVCWVYTISCLQ